MKALVSKLSPHFFLLCFLIFLGSILARSTASAAPRSFESDNITGFEILNVGPCEIGIECMMGHTVLRLVGTGANPQDDFTVAFTTDAVSGPSLKNQVAYGIQAIVALPLSIYSGPLKEIYNAYSVREGRSIDRIPLQTTPDMKRRLIHNLNELLKSPEKEDGYNYLFSNCTGLIVKLLEDSGFASELFGIAIPSNLPAYLFRTYGTLYPPLRVPPSANFKMAFQSLPASMYTFCESTECAREVRAQFLEIWPGQTIEWPEFAPRDREIEPATLRTRTEPTHWNGLKPIVVRHFNLLRES